MNRLAIGIMVGNLAFALVGRAGQPEPGQIILHAAFASPERLVVEGRVLEDQGVRRADQGRSGIGNLVDSVKTFESDEIEGVVLELTIDGQAFTVTTDADGCFRLAGVAPPRPLRGGRRPLSIAAIDGRGFAIPRIDGTIPVVPAGAVAVLSDFDDTVAETQVTDKPRMLVRTLTRNAAQLQAVPGAAVAYQAALVAGAAAIVYVSGSPQNLQPRIAEFLDLQEIPRGPLLLKNIGADSLTEQEGYKLRRIDQVMAALPGVRFVLVGDSGEKDPEIYRQVLRAHPGRVLGVVIRKVSGADNGEARLQGMLGVDDYAADPQVLARLIAGAAGE